MSTREERLTLRIFLASPGDVADERGLARRVMASLPKEPAFRGRIDLEEVSWDNPGSAIPLPAHLTPQDAIKQGIPTPAECDVVLVVLWSRMGTPLPGSYAKQDGSRYLSGTEWEYLAAIERAEKEGTPIVLVYQRTEKVLFDPDDPDFDERTEQRRKVLRFFESFRNPDGSLKRSYREYATPSDFEQILEVNLRKVVWDRYEVSGLDAIAPGEGDRGAVLWSGSPYPGLRAFTDGEGAIFFGRGHETDALVRHVSGGARFVAVIGPSGSGKSSLVAAGLLPRIAAGALRGGEQWVSLRFTPGQVGNDPFIALADRLAQQFARAGWKTRDLADRLRSDATMLAEIVQKVLVEREPVAELVLFVDQLEELFTLVAKEQRAPFIALLVAASGIERLRVVITMRADFYAHCLEWESLATLLRDGAVPISPPGVTALVEMITRPAQAAGLDLESGLVDRILADTGTEPGALALMEFLLSKLYEQRSGKQLTLAAYQALGGVAGIIEAQGEGAVRGAGGAVDEAAIAPIFEALVNVDPDPRVGTTRRRADLARFDAASRALVDRLADARLLVTTGDATQGGAVEVAHEAVLRNWRRLALWVNANRSFLLWQHRLRSDLEDYARDPRLLLQDARLGEARNWLRARARDLSDDERGFIEASVRALQLRRLKIVASGLCVGVVVGGAAWGIEYYLRTRPLLPVMIDVPAGSFTMGSGPGAPPIEQPAHAVTFRQGFRIGRDEITAEEYFRCFNASVCKGGGGAPREPVTNVNLKDANDYARWLSQKTGRRFRLPSEAEWEYAARAGTTTAYWWGEEPKPDQANCSGCTERPKSQDRTGPVGLYPANPWGLHDTAGNVWEWTQDCRHASYAGAPTDGQAWEAANQGECGFRVVRGGSWGDRVESARSAFRFPRPGTSRFGRVGFRLAEDLP